MTHSHYGLQALLYTVAPEAVLGLSTGSSPLGTYQALSKLVRRGEVDLSRASGFARVSGYWRSRSRAAERSPRTLEGGAGCPAARHG